MVFVYIGNVRLLLREQRSVYMRDEGQEKYEAFLGIILYVMGRPLHCDQCCVNGNSDCASYMLSHRPLRCFIPLIVNRPDCAGRRASAAR